MRWLPRTSMPRSRALAGRGGKTSSSSSEADGTSSGSSTNANLHARPLSHASGITTSGERLGSGCKNSRPVSHRCDKWIPADAGVMAMRVIRPASPLLTAPSSPQPNAPSNREINIRSVESSGSPSISPSVIGRGRPQTFPTTSSCMRHGFTIAQFDSVDPTRSMRKTSIPAPRLASVTRM